MRLSDVSVPNAENFGDDFVDSTDYCACDLSADEKEQASARCKACGKPIFDFLDDTGEPCPK